MLCASLPRRRIDDGRAHSGTAQRRRTRLVRLTLTTDVATLVSFLACFGDVAAAQSVFDAAAQSNLHSLSMRLSDAQDCLKHRLPNIAVVRIALARIDSREVAPSNTRKMENGPSVLFGSHRGAVRL